MLCLSCLDQDVLIFPKRRAHFLPIEAKSHAGFYILYALDGIFFFFFKFKIYSFNVKPLFSIY